MALAFSCTRQSDTNNGVDRSTIKIGYFGDLTGPTFNFGRSAYNGVLMAADEINNAGGINGRRIDVVFEDDRGSAEEAARLTAKLIDQDKVIAIIAGGVSGNSRAAAPKAQSSHIPLISPSSTDPAVTQTGDYIFRACFVDSFQGEVMASFAANTLKAQKAAIIYDFNSPYGRGLTEYFELSFAKLGGQIVSKQTYKQGDADAAIKALDVNKQGGQFCVTGTGLSQDPCYPTRQAAEDALNGVSTTSTQSFCIQTKDDETITSDLGTTAGINR